MVEELYLVVLLYNDYYVITRIQFVYLKLFSDQYNYGVRLFFIFRRKTTHDNPFNPTTLHYYYVIHETLRVFLQHLYVHHLETTENGRNYMAANVA